MPIRSASSQVASLPGAVVALTTAPGRLQQGDVLAGRYVRRALEHDVLEEMGESGAALLLISGTDVVPDVDCHGRRDVVWTGDDAQSVSQGVLDNRVAELGERPKSCPTSQHTARAQLAAGA